MDFRYRDDERAVAELARKILEDHATNERLQAHEASGAPFDRAAWRALAEAQLLGTAVPEGHGGVNLGFLALSLLMQEVGRTVAPIPAFATLVLGALPLARFGSAAVQEAWLPGVVAGTHVLTAALAEYGSSDPLVPETRVVRDGADYRLDGTKTMVPFAAEAERVLVPARFDDGSIGLFLLAPDAPGVTLAAQETADRHPHAEMQLREVPVSADDRLVADGDGADALRWLVEHATVARCMMQLGVVERALQMTASYTRERVQFERPIGSFQAVHQRAADAYINVEAVRLSAQEAAWRLSRDLPAAEHVAVAKYWAAEGGQFAAYACQHLHGGIGIDVDYPLHRHFIWAIQIEHELGSARRQLDVLGQTLVAGGLSEI